MPGHSPESDETLSMISQAAADFAKPDAQRRRIIRNSSDGFDRTIWSDMAGQGWLGVLVPEAAGGIGLGVEAAARIAERVGYACFTEPFVEVAVLAARCVALCPDSPERSRLLGGICSGALVVALAWQGPGGRLRPGDAAVNAIENGDHVRLDGEARFVVPSRADTFVLAALMNGKLALLTVSADTRGLSIQHEKSADGCTSARIAFADVTIPASQVLVGSDAETIVGAALEESTLCTAAELLGLIDRSIEITQSYLGTRKQFGQSIGSFQVLQHRMVDIWMQKELTRAALMSALKVFVSEGTSMDERRAAASNAKARASQAALIIAGQSLQMHGAIGFSDEYELGIYVNRSLVLAARHGNAAFHRRRYGDLVHVRER